MSFKHLSTAEQVLAHIRAALERRYRQPAGALVSIAIQVGETRQFLAGRLQFRDEQHAGRGRTEYPGLVLVEDWIPIENLWRWLENTLSNKGELCGTAIPGQLGGASAKSHAAGAWALLGWRVESVECQLDALRDNVPGEPVVSVGKEPFADMRDAAREWVYLPDGWKWESGIPCAGNLVIMIPDTRGRITEAEWTQNAIQIALEKSIEGRDVELQVIYRGSAMRRFEVVPSPGDNVVLEPPGDAQAAELLLVYRDELLGQIHLDLTRRYYSVLRPASAPVAAIDGDLQSGENEEVEYKPFIEPRSQKMQEVVETVVSFANSRGGRIYVGVTDRGEPQGIGGLNRAFRAVAPDVALTQASEALKSAVTENVKPVPPFQVLHVRVADQPVIVVAVDAGRDKPYATRNNNVYLRKGSSNMKPDPRTELPWLLREPGLPL